jgi:methanogenic corrinoid protein MtbC1
VETIRTWDQRYGSPAAMRKPSGHRLYAAGAVEQLRRVGRLLARGHRPGEILRLSLPELDKLLDLSEPASAKVEPLADDVRIAATHERLMRAALDLDRAATMQVLQSSWAGLGPLRFLERVAGDFMVAVGRAWTEERLEVAHEHFTSACLADFLRGVREPFDQQARGPRVVAAMLPGERHEGGLLMSSVLLAVRGYRVVYLGLDTPIEQIAAAARARNAEAVAISVSAGTARSRAAHGIKELRKALARRVKLWVGGAGAPPSIDGVELFESLSAFDERLRIFP